MPSRGQLMKSLLPKMNMRDMTSFDPAAGRGYRIGDQKLVPAGSGFNGVPPVNVANHGAADVIARWKVTFYVRDPAGSDSAQLGSRLRIVTLSKMENDEIPRRCTVTLDDAQVIYAPGRALQIFAYNPMPFDLVIEYNLDEVTAGLSRWEDVEFFRFDTLTTGPCCDGVGVFAPNPPTGLPAHDPDEQPLDIPPFCSGFAVYSDQQSPAFSTGVPATGIFPNLPLIRGYGRGGGIVYQDILLTPHSPFVDRIPGLDYTIRIFNPVAAVIAPLTLQTGGPAHMVEYAVYYNCDG
jgi:hypothetical protein